MQKATKKKSIFVLTLIALALLFCAPVVASANALEVSKTRAELKLDLGQNALGQSLFDSSKRDLKDNRFQRTASGSPLAPKTGPHSQIAGQIDSLANSGLTGAKRLRPDELATGRRLERLLGRRLRESAHEGAEFVDDFGRSFDALGGGSQASKFFNSKKFFNSINKHLRKSNDFTAIDLNGFTPSQISQVRKFLGGLSQSELDRIIRIGF